MERRPGKTIHSSCSAIHYIAWGQGEQVILALHKVSGGAEAWLEPLRGLDQDYRFIAPDLRGHGYSSCQSRSFLAEDFCRDLVYLIESLDLRNIIVLGHSFGARLALELTQKFNDQQESRIKAIVCVEPPLCGPGKEPYPYDVQSAIDWRRGVVREGVDFCMRTNPAYTLTQAELRTKYGLLCNEDVLEGVWHYFNHVSMDTLAINLRLPALLLRGSNGVISSEEAEAFSGLSENIRLHIMPGGHNLPWENSPDFCALVRQFLNELYPCAV